MARCEIDQESNELAELMNFKSFSEECENFSLHHGLDIASTLWNGIKAVKENLVSTLLRLMERVGSSFNSTKSKIFNLPSASWKCMKFHLVLQDSAIQEKE